MGRVDHEALRLTCPLFTDELVRCEQLESVKPSGEVVGADEVGERLFELRVFSSSNSSSNMAWL